MTSIQDWLSELALVVLMGLSGLIGVTELPKEPSDVWQITDPGWIHSVGKSEVSARSKKIIDECKKSPTGYIHFPGVIHGAQKIYADDTLIESFGYPDFDRVRSFYGAPTVACDRVIGASVVRWEVVSYSRYFARLSFYPKTYTGTPFHNLFNETLAIVASGTLLFLAFFSLMFFWGKVSFQLSLSVFISNLLISGYFLSSTAGFFNWPVDMLTAHKVADFALWGGMLSFLYSLYRLDLIRLFEYKIFAGHVVVALVVIFLGTNGDVIQLGTTIPFASALIPATLSIFRQARGIRGLSDRSSLLKVLILLIFVGSAINDISLTIGLVEGIPLFSIGIVVGLMLIALSVNEEVIQAYRERDYLREHLEEEVEVKTKALATKSDELQETLSDLKDAQAELVQKEKLASLGTFSAGIAHEINNAVNYVNGAISPLEKQVKDISDEKKKAKIVKLLGVIKDGTTLTKNIVSSLRNYTGMNKAKFNNVSVKETIESVLTIIRSNLRNITVQNDIPPDLNVYGDTVGLNQIFMNLITNAIDAMGGQGELKFHAESNRERARISVSDSGDGIPEEVLNRIFDPFFTTKDVGQGTGLGLHIIKQEVEKHGGKLEVQTKVGEGTTFIVDMPINNPEVEDAAA